METKLFFPYTWHEDEDEEHVTAIRIFGIDTENKNVQDKNHNNSKFNKSLNLFKTINLNKTMIKIEI